LDFDENAAKMLAWISQTRGKNLVGETKKKQPNKNRYNCMLTVLANIYFMATPPPLTI
jgi:hypothetical protein